MFIIAEMYRKGEGTKKDLEKSLYWYEKAEENGHVRAKQLLNQIRSSIETRRLDRNASYNKEFERKLTSCKLKCENMARFATAQCEGLSARGVFTSPWRRCRDTISSAKNDCKFNCSGF